MISIYTRQYSLTIALETSAEECASALPSSPAASPFMLKYWDCVCPLQRPRAHTHPFNTFFFNIVPRQLLPYGDISGFAECSMFSLRRDDLQKN
ncbi:hypothetical protein EVAR_63903_1 [Eumeta japonica]|uniref:Uncharacterized protein n=1 Tax=Eumeta variegata TaxID=151549 RepID=A0A4C1ZNY5_EUMVA|nr:hypothetical protein EVAR_63903_1 [Eumeta japonica]